MATLFVRGLPDAATRRSSSSLFGAYGMDLLNGRGRGTCFGEMEGHEARAAINGLDGSEFEGRTITIYVIQGKGQRNRARRRR